MSVGSCVFCAADSYKPDYGHSCTPCPLGMGTNGLTGQINNTCGMSTIIKWVLNFGETHSQIILHAWMLQPILV